MPTTLCWESVRGKVARYTKNNSCGAPVAGAKNTLVSDGFVSVEYAIEYEDGEEMSQKKADGKFAFLFKDDDQIKWVLVNIKFTGVNPDLLGMVRGQPLVLDHEGNAVGIRIGQPVATDWGLETWTDIPGTACTTAKPFGYFLAPWPHGGKLSNFTIENGAAEFGIEGARAIAGSQWSTGPYNVDLHEAVSSALPAPGKLRADPGRSAPGHAPHAGAAARRDVRGICAGTHVVAACGWVVDWSTTPCSSASEQDKAVAEQLAAATLWALSGRVFGVCPETVRPGPAPAGRPSTYHGGARHAGWWPQQMTSGWPTGGCGCSTACDCSADRLRVALPGPVQSVTTVWVDGAELASTAYRVQDRRWLLRVDGKTWPRHQDLTIADHDAGAFTVAYMRGIPIPTAGKAALGELACEFVKACNGSGKCAIPSRAQQISRQGVSIELIDPATLSESGLTGVETVDRWLASVNPGLRRAPSRVYSPDAPRTARLR